MAGQKKNFAWAQTGKILTYVPRNADNAENAGRFYAVINFRSKKNIRLFKASSADIPNASFSPCSVL